MNKKKRQSPFALAGFYAKLEDKENTLKYLEEVWELDSIDIPRINPDPMFNFVRKEPRFRALLKKSNL